MLSILDKFFTFEKRNALLFCSLNQNFVTLNKLLALGKEKINANLFCHLLSFL